MRKANSIKGNIEKSLSNVSSTVTEKVSSAAESAKPKKKSSSQKKKSVVNDLEKGEKKAKSAGSNLDVSIDSSIS